MSGVRAEICVSRSIPGDLIGSGGYKGEGGQGLKQPRTKCHSACWYCIAGGGYEAMAGEA